jgi:hypothetical protein
MPKRSEDFGCGKFLGASIKCHSYSKESRQIHIDPLGSGCSSGQPYDFTWQVCVDSTLIPSGPAIRPDRLGLRSLTKE